MCLVLVIEWSAALCIFSSLGFSSFTPPLARVSPPLPSFLPPARAKLRSTCLEATATRHGSTISTAQTSARLPPLPTPPTPAPRASGGQGSERGGERGERITSGQPFEAWSTKISVGSQDAPDIIALVHDPSAPLTPRRPTSARVRPTQAPALSGGTRPCGLSRSRARCCHYRQGGARAHQGACLPRADRKGADHSLRMARRRMERRMAGRAQDMDAKTSWQRVEWPSCVVQHAHIHTHAQLTSLLWRLCSRGVPPSGTGITSLSARSDGSLQRLRCVWTG